MSHYRPGEQDNSLHILKFLRNHIRNKNSRINKVSLKSKFSRSLPLADVQANNRVKEAGSNGTRNGIHNPSLRHRNYLP
jgi:hypothetical protein